MKSQSARTLSLILICVFLAGCSLNNNESSNESAGTEMIADQDDSIEDISKIEQIFIDEYSKQNDHLKCVGKILEKLGDSGFVAIDSDNKVDMTNADLMMQFISSRESGEHARISVLQVFYTRGLNYIDITADEGNVGVEQTYFTFEDNQLSFRVIDIFKRLRHAGKSSLHNRFRRFRTVQDDPLPRHTDSPVAVQPDVKDDFRAQTVSF